MGAEEQEEAAAPLEGKKQQKTSKDVYFCVLPDKYEPLIEEGEEGEEEEEERRRRKEEKKRKRKKRCKKCRKLVEASGITCRVCGLWENQLDHHDDLQALKAELETRTVFPPVLLVSLVLNICKALRYSWRILLAGVQSMASAYSTPLSAMPTVVMEMKRPGDSMA